MQWFASRMMQEKREYCKEKIPQITHAIGKDKGRLTTFKICRDYDANPD